MNIIRSLVRVSFHAIIGISMNQQQVYEVTVYKGIPAQGPPSVIVLIQFGQAALQIMSGRGQDPEMQARMIAKSLALGPGAHANGGTRIERIVVDVDSLGQPTTYPDDAGTRAWVGTV
jgi:hypothetical protein